jgi:hypothetical protein
MNEVSINIEKIDGGFLVYVNSTEGPGFRKIVRKLSEVVAIVKDAMTDQLVSNQ